MVTFDVDEEQEGDEGQRESRVDQRVVPGDDIAAGVQADEKQNQCRNKRCCTEEVDTL